MSEYKLVMGSEGQLLPCVSVEVTERWLSILTTTVLDPTTNFSLSNGVKTFNLRLLPDSTPGPLGTCYRFQGKDTGGSIGALLFSRSEDPAQRPNAPSLLNANLLINGCTVKTARFSVTAGHVAVAARTMGTRADYHLKPVNISKSGFLLSQQGGSPAPFNVNTLIEVGMAIRHGDTQANITCLGKVVRCVREQNPQGGDTFGFGVQIIEIDPSQMHVWEKYVASVETVGTAA